MKLHILSDLHLEFADFQFDEAAIDAANVIILAGDIAKGVDGIGWTRHWIPKKPIIYVPGNHELYDGHWTQTIEDMRATADAHGVHFLENDSVIINGVRFLGATLWTDFEFFQFENFSYSMRCAEKGINDYQLIEVDAGAGAESKSVHPRLTAKMTLERHQASRHWLERELADGDRDKTVVITHHLPHSNSVAPVYKRDWLTAAFASHLPPDLISQSRLWIHGHTHSSSDYRIRGASGEARVICNPRGYPLRRQPPAFENADFNGALVIDLFAPDHSYTSVE
jgi:Icc-related predicted phosphoesterase